MRRLALLILVGGILHWGVHADAGERPPGQPEYFPMVLGDRWVYSVYSNILDTIIGQDAISIDDRTEFQGETFYHLSSSWFPIYSVWVHPNEAGDLYWCDSPGGTEHPLLLFSDAGRDGWLLGGRHCIDSVSKTDCHTPITTPMGAFENVICLTSAWRVGDCDAYWRGSFAAGVGPIEWVMMAAAGATLTWQLVEFIPAMPSACKCHGDPVCDGILDVRDVVTVISVAFRGVPAELERGCSWFARQAAGGTDLDCSGKTDIIDVVLAVNSTFHGAAPPKAGCRNGDS